MQERAAWCASYRFLLAGELLPVVPNVVAAWCQNVVRWYDNNYLTVIGDAQTLYGEAKYGGKPWALVGYGPFQTQLSKYVGRNGCSSFQHVSRWYAEHPAMRATPSTMLVGSGLRPRPFFNPAPCHVRAACDTCCGMRATRRGSGCVRRGPPHGGAGGVRKPRYAIKT